MIGSRESANKKLLADMALSATLAASRIELFGSATIRQISENPRLILRLLIHW